MQIESPFDIMAETYDQDFTWSKIGSLQRARVRSRLLPFLKEINKDASLLEMNCGTGEDAIWLSQLGYRVTATDASERMIKKAVNKKQSTAIDDQQLEFISCMLQNLGDRFPGEQFDWIFSNFGGINCLGETEISKLAGELNGMLKPGGKMALVIMSRFCLWETGYYFLRGKWRSAFRRAGTENMLNVGGYILPFYHYSPARISALFKPFFKTIEQFPVGLLVPPSYLEGNFAKRSSWLDRLDRWENKLSRFGFLSGSADHFCIVFKKS